MKKGFRITSIIVGSLLAVVLLAAIIIPVAFRDKIKETVERSLNEMLVAEVTFDDYRLSLFRAFPDASFSLNNLTITGKEEFEGDTLASVRSFRIVINLKSLFGSDGYEIRSVTINKPFVNAIVNEQGRANWDIMRPDTETDQSGRETGSGNYGVNLLLRKFAVINGALRYSDREADMSATVEDLGLLLSGKMSGSHTALDLLMNARSLNVIADKIPWLTNATLSFRAEIDALLDSMKFILKENVLTLNDITLNLEGMAAMPDDDIEVDMIFSAPETSFKSLLSMVPALYMKGYEDLRAAGTILLEGAVRGVYSSADSILPDVNLHLTVTDGVISYPELPEKISAIHIDGRVQTDGREMDNSVAELSRFHFELAGNPFDLSLRMATPVSDPSVKLAARGRVDLAKLQQALPLDSLTLSGIIDMALELAGNMSALDEQRYDQFTATGGMKISDMSLDMREMPEVRIDEALLRFTPAYAELGSMRALVGEGSDFALTGRLENYVSYLFSDGTLRGNLSLRSEAIDLNEIMSYIPADTIDTDTIPMELIRIPDNIDFSFDAHAGRLTYGRLSATDLQGRVAVREGVVTLSETGMNAMGGTLLVNAVYDTRDSLKPLVDGGMEVRSVLVREAFNSLNSVRQLMPVAAGLDGRVSAKIDFNSYLGSGMMPLLNSLSGSGMISSEALQIIESQSFEKMKNLLKLNPAYTNVIKDLKASFIINEGRLFVKPFDTRLGNIKLNVSGDQGLDQTISYMIMTEIPGSDLGGAAQALMSTFASQAAALGITPGVPEVIRVNLKVGGTFRDPVITPLFGGAGGVSNTAVSAVKSVTDSIKSDVAEKVGEAARQQAEKIVREAEEKAQRVRQEAATAAEGLRREAAARGEKLVKDAESKGVIAVAAARKAADALVREADKRGTQLEQEAGSRADELVKAASEKAGELLR